MLQDARFALRSLRSHAAYAWMTILTITLVVGAGSAVLAVISATFLRPLPFADDSRLVWIYGQPPGTEGDPQRRNPLHSTEFVRFREGLRQFDGIAGIWGRERALGWNGEAEPVASGSVSANYFDVLGLSPAVGRMFTDAEDAADAKVAVVSDAFWRSHLGGAAALGQTLRIDGESYAVIGVMPPIIQVDFADADVFTPLHMDAGHMLLPRATLVSAVGRLKRGVSVDQVNPEIAAAMAAVVQEDPDSYTGWSAGAMPLRDALFGDSKPALGLLFAAILLLTVIACANLANLTIAEVMGRRDEIALRTALGAGRATIVRLLSLEHVAVAFIGGAIGLLVAQWVLPAVLALDPSTAAALGPVTIDWRVELAALVLALIVSFVSGIVPAVAATRGDLARALAQGGRRTAGSRQQHRARAWLVGVETLVAAVLLTVSVLLLTAFNRSAALPPGFDPTHTLATQVRLPTLGYETADARAEFVTRVVAEITALPGVTAAGVTNPLSAGGGYQTGMYIEGYPSIDGRPYTAQFRRVSAGYFGTLRIPLIRGRVLADADNAISQPVAVVNASFAKQYWHDDDPIGQRVIRVADPTHPLTVVGIVGDANDVGLAVAPPPLLYVAYAQNNSSAAPLTIVVRTAGDPHDIVPDVTRAVHRVDAQLPLTRTMTMEEFMRASLGSTRFRSVLLLMFAIVGLALAAVGIYGVTSRGVSERTRELGVRLALGSGRAQLWRLVLAQSFAAVAIGLAISVPVSIGTIAVLGHWLPDLSASQAITAMPAVVLLGLAGFVAAAVPALRAARLDPIVALRAD